MNESFENLIQKYNRELVRMHAKSTAKMTPGPSAEQQDSADERGGQTSVSASQKNAPTPPKEVLEVAPVQSGAISMAENAETEVPTEIPDIQNSQNADPAPSSEETESPGTEQELLYPSYLSETGSGNIKIRCFTAREALPVEDATVIVQRTVSGKNYLYYVVQTDQNGFSFSLPLPAPAKSESQQPSDDRPYSTFEVQAFHPGFLKAVVQEVTVFDTIESVISIEMIPSFNDKNDQPLNQDIIIPPSHLILPE